MGMSRNERTVATATRTKGRIPPTSEDHKEQMTDHVNRDPAKGWFGSMGVEARSMMHQCHDIGVFINTKGVWIVRESIGRTKASF